jgi:dTDP-4-amino-4,6-dideoxygalactose transaminase
LIAAARKAGATLIEDAAQGVGGTIVGRPLGSHGDFGVLSFGRGKGRTGGCGGALIANNSNAAARLERVAPRVAPAVTRKSGLIALTAQWAVGRPWGYAVPSSIPSLRLGETIYHPPSPIREMPEWAAAVVSALWLRSAEEAVERRAAAERWARLLTRNTRVCAFTECNDTTAGWLRFPVLVNEPLSLLGADARRLGIMPGYRRLLADLPLAPGRLASHGPWPGAAQLASRLRTLPSHSLLNSTDVAAIVKLLERREHPR